MTGTTAVFSDIIVHVPLGIDRLLDNQPAIARKFPLSMDVRQIQAGKRATRHNRYFAHRYALNNS